MGCTWAVPRKAPGPQGPLELSTPVLQNEAKAVQATHGGLSLTVQSTAQASPAAESVVYFASQSDRRVSDLLLGLSIEMITNHWGRPLFDPMPRLRVVAENLIGASTLVIYIKDRSSPSSNLSVGEITQGEEIEIALRLKKRIVRLVALPTSDTDVSAIRVFSGGRDRVKMWRSILNVGEDRIHTTLYEPDRLALIQEKLISEFSAVYFIAAAGGETMVYDRIARTLCLSGIHSRLLNELDDLALLLNNPRAFLVVMMSPGIFLHTPIALRALRLLRKRRGGRNRILCVRLRSLPNVEDDVALMEAAKSECSQRGLDFDLPVVPIELRLETSFSEIEEVFLRTIRTHLDKLQSTETALPLNLVPCHFFAHHALIDYHGSQVPERDSGLAETILRKIDDTCKEGTSLICIVAPAGFGKSTLMSSICRLRSPLASGLCQVPPIFSDKDAANEFRVVGFHFFRFQDGHHSSMRTAIRSLHAQLCTSFLGLGSLIDAEQLVEMFEGSDDLVTMFTELIIEPLRVYEKQYPDVIKGLGQKRQVIVMDAIDECDDHQELSRAFRKARYLFPKWLCLVVSCAHGSQAMFLRDTDAIVIELPQSEMRAAFVHRIRSHYGDSLMSQSIVEGLMLGVQDTHFLWWKFMRDRMDDYIHECYESHRGLDWPHFLTPLLKRTSTTEGLYEYFLESWALSSFAGDEERFRLTLATMILLPREAVPERIWVDLNLSDSVPMVFRRYDTSTLKCPHLSLFKFIQRREIIASIGSASVTWKGHQLLARILEKSKWLVDELPEPASAPDARVAVRKPLMGAFIADQAENDALLESHQSDEESDSAIAHRSDDNSDEDVSNEGEYHGNENCAMPPIQTESVLEAAADVRRSFLGSVADESTHALDGSSDGGIRKYRIVRRLTSLFNNDASEPLSPSMSLPTPPSHSPSAFAARQRNSLSLIVDALKAARSTRVVSEEERFAVEHCAYHWYQASAARSFLTDAGSGSTSDQEEDGDDTDGTVVDALERYEEWFGRTSLDKLLLKVKITLAWDTYGINLIRDASLGLEHTQFVREVLVRARRALKIDVNQLAGQILGRIRPELERVFPEAARLVMSVNSWLDRNAVHYSAIALPNRLFSGLVPVGGDLQREINQMLPVYAVASLNNSRIACGGWDGNVRVFNTQSGVQECLVECGEHPVLCMAVNSERTLLACGTGNGAIMVFEVLLGHSSTQSSLQLRNTYKHSRKKINGVYIGSVGDHSERLLSASEDGSLVVWDLAKYSTKAEEAAEDQGFVKSMTQLHTGAICSVAAGTALICTGGVDRLIRIVRWSDATAEGEQVLVAVASLKGHGGEVRSLLVDDASNLIISGSSDKTVRVWDQTSLECLRVIVHSHFGTILAMDIQYPYLLTGSDKLRVIDLEHGETIRTFKCAGHGITSATFVKETTSGGSANDVALAMVSASENHVISVWRSLVSSQDKHSESELGPHSLIVTGVSVDRSGELAITSSLDRTARIWDTTTGNVKHVLRGHSDVVYCCSMSRDGLRCATGSLDRTARVYDSLTGEALQTLGGHSDVVFSVFVSSGTSTSPTTAQSRRLVVTGSYDGALVFDAESGERLNDKGLDTSLFDIPAVAATDRSDGYGLFTVPGVDHRAVGFTPDFNGDDLKKVGRFVFGQVENSFALWTIW